MHELIHTKVAPPIWMGDQIRRDPLLERLDDALNRRLTLIHAPAGYGKTSLLSQWRRCFDDKAVLVAWLTMERDDSDIERLAQYIWLAINGTEAHETQGDEGERISGDLPPRAALSAIINRLAREPRAVIIILDDLHRAESSVVLDFLQSLIRLAPENCHFVIASRDYPSLGQSVLAAEEQLLEFNADDLKFSGPEAETLLSRTNGGDLDGMELRSIVDRTEGWPIAIQLTSLSLKRGIDHRRLVERFSGPSSELARYLSEQVLMALPPETQEIVTRTALIDLLTGDMVNLLCDREDGWMVLERLEQQGVFLTPSSPERDAYRYHQLFAEYLRERLARSDNNKFRSLNARAAEYFAEEGDIAKAISHAIQAEDNEMLADILEDAGGWRLIPQGLQGVVERGLKKLSDAVVATHPRLMLAKVYLQIKCGEMGAARIGYDEFTAAATDAGLSADLRIEMRVVGDVLADYENLSVTLDDLLTREALLRTLPANDHLVLANFSETLGAKYFEGGWLERALEPTLSAREHYQALGSLYSDLFTRFLEARIKRAQGRLTDAAAILATARSQIESSFGARSDLAANCAAFEAELLYEQGRLQEAEALLDWALPHMEQFDGWVDVYAAAYLTAARAAAGNGALDEAHAIVARARRLAMRRRLRQLELLANLGELELLILHGTTMEAAHACAAEIGLDAMADEMALECPGYRPVALTAALCRSRLALADERYEAALVELREIRHWATQRGAGRLLIDVNILMAYALKYTGDSVQAQSCFDEAVGMAMFQGITRPFIDARRFAEPSLQDTLEGSSQLDRFRDQFLRTISKSLSSQQTNAAASTLLNEAEATILQHLSCGYSNKEIARLINMSPDTVKYRLKSVFRKIGVNKRRDAVRISRERGLVILAGSQPSTIPDEPNE